MPRNVFAPRHRRRAPFKVVALVIDKKCHEEYRNILKPDLPYFFYTNYRFNGDILEHDSNAAEILYNTERLSINISAIVGKNGTGKSSIIDLLFRVINNVAAKNDGVSTALLPVSGLAADLFIHSDAFYRIRVNRLVTIHRQRENSWVRVENDRSFLRNFCYTIAVNYSQHAYLEKDHKVENDWVDGVFHKNDGYQTPLVINPYREDGIINMKSEAHLVRSRLIANLLKGSNPTDFPFRRLSENRDAVSLELVVSDSKDSVQLYEMENKTKTPVLTSDIEFPQEYYNQVDSVFKLGLTIKTFMDNKLAMTYIKYKLISIALKYDDYKRFFDKPTKKLKNFPDYLLLLKDDESHITFKLRQIFNFLKYNTLSLKNQTITLDEFGGKLTRLFRKHKIVSRELIYYIPPPIFKTDILYKTQQDAKLLPFRKLSSGEKQQIYAINSVLYHLINLHSVNNSKNRIAYRHINVVLEEVEMYSHPEMQRTYVHTMLDCIKHLYLPRMNSLNICFVTHSPFVLSDIPVSNILFLDDYGKPADMKGTMETFGGNIHEMLAQGFFLRNGLMGKFAQERIQVVIDVLNGKTKLELPNRDIEDLIAMIGEPFLKQKLHSMYRKKLEDMNKSA